jgi:2-haloacid dehalogenase
MMKPKRLYVFDAYGTLLDVHSAVAKHVATVGDDAARLSDVWRTKQLEYTWTLSLMGRYEPFWSLTERALDFALDKFPSIDRAVRNELLAAYCALNAYPEVANALTLLRDRGAKTAVLSNGNRAMLDASFAVTNLTSLLDALISVDDVRVFKVHSSVYQRALDVFQVERSDVLFVSSNRWDVAGAAAFGLETAWINRSAQPDEYKDLPANYICSSLSDLLTV